MMTGSDLVDGRRARGALSRQAITTAAAQAASVHGLRGVTVAAIAAEVSMSKAGVAALFGTKEKLQLAAISAAAELFRNVVIAPTRSEKGVVRLHSLVDHWLVYSRERVFRGGCFFAAVSSEFSALSGDVKDAIVASLEQWHRFLRAVIQDAVARGELPDDTDSSEVVFAITALLDGANRDSLLWDSPLPYTQARSAITRLLGTAETA